MNDSNRDKLNKTMVFKLINDLEPLLFTLDPSSVKFARTLRTKLPEFASQEFTVVLTNLERIEKRMKLLSKELRKLRQVELKKQRNKRYYARMKAQRRKNIAKQMRTTGFFDKVKKILKRNEENPQA